MGNKLERIEYLEAKRSLLRDKLDRADFRAGYWDTPEDERLELRNKVIVFRYEINELYDELTKLRGW